METRIDALRNLLNTVQDYRHYFCGSPDECSTYDAMIRTIEGDIRRATELAARMAKLAAKA